MNSFEAKESTSDKEGGNMPQDTSNPQISSANPFKYLSKRIVIIGIAILLVVGIGAGSGVYYYIKYQTAQKILGDSIKAPDTGELVKKVGQLIELPKGEKPAVATVSDVAKLKDKPFFANAKNGDKVLIYQKAKKAILFDPVVNKLIMIDSINITTMDFKTQSAIQTPTPAQAVKVAIFNGTKTVGLASSTEKILAEKAKNVNVVVKKDARDLYIKTIVIDLSGTHAAGAVQIAKLLKGEMGTLPVGEVKPLGADILVILGSL